MKINAILNLNFQYSGALIDANQLIARGWRDMTGMSDIGEWIRCNSTWVEFVETHEKREYHVQCSLSWTIVSKNENGSMCFADSDYVRRAHDLQVPRKAFLRRIHVWICDEDAMTFEEAKGNVPQEIVERAAADLAEAVLEPARLFADDIAYQTRGYEKNAPDRKGSLVDQQFYILAPIVHKEFLNKGIESVGRLLTPFTRALLTEDDPVGRKYALGIMDPEVVEMLAEWTKDSDFHAAAIALLQIASRENLRDRLSHQTWTTLAHAAATLGALKEFSQVCQYTFECVRKIDDKTTRAQLRQSLYWMAVSVGNNIRENDEDFALVVETFAKNMDLYEDHRPMRLWLAVAQCYIRQREGKRVPSDWLEAIMGIIQEALKEYNDEHKAEFKKKPHHKNLGPGVKAPLEWQAFLFSWIGLADDVLCAFPKPVSFDVMNNPYLPPIETVEGLGFWDIWDCFVAEPWNEAVRDKWVDVTTKTLKAGRVFNCQPSISWLGVMHDIESYQVFEPESPETAELTSVAIYGKLKNVEGFQFITSFPFLPKEYPENRANATVKVRRYRIWEGGHAADVEFETEFGECLTAVMPYFVADYGAIPRGIRMEGMLVAFAQEIRKGDIPDHPESFTVSEGPLAENHVGPVTVHFADTVFDYLAQDTCPEEISRAGFGIQGRIQSLREIDAFNTRVLAIEVACARLEKPLRVYIAKEILKESIRVDDTIEAYGWLYLDLFKRVDTYEEYMSIYPVAGPRLEEIDPMTDGVPTYVRTEYTDEERKANRSVNLHHDWRAYGRRMLERCKGVTRVEHCEMNPLGASYLVRMNGKVVKYRMVVAQEGESPSLHYPGVEVFVLRLKHAMKGYKLFWEGLPGETKTTADS